VRDVGGGKFSLYVCRTYLPSFKRLAGCGTESHELNSVSKRRRGERKQSGGLFSLGGTSPGFLPSESKIRSTFRTVPLGNAPKRVKQATGVSKTSSPLVRRGFRPQPQSGEQAAQADAHGAQVGDFVNFNLGVNAVAGFQDGA